MSESTTTENPIRSSHHRLEIALGDEKTVDVFFVFEIGNRLTRIASHKMILASKSVVFLKMFSNELKHIDDIHVTDATAEHFKKFLQMFYDDKNSIEHISIKNIAEILYLALKYDAVHCKNACEKFLSATLNGKNALFIMELALLCDNEEIIQKCAFEIAADAYGILAEEEFYKCSPNVLECFLENIDEDDFYSSSYSSVPAEICVACMEWARQRCNEQNIDASKPENLRNQLNDFFADIPFHYMKRDEFHDFLAEYADIFKVDEIKAICSRK